MKPLRARIIVIPLFGLLLATLSLSGQTAGASMDSVRLTEGEPAMIRKKGDQEIWMYEDGRKFTFHNGVVEGGADPSARQEVAVANEPETDLAQVGAETTAATTAPVSPPAPAEPRVSVVQAPRPAMNAEPEEAEREMPIVPLVLVLAMLLVTVVANIWFIVLAFKESVLWGFGCLCVPFVSLVFLVKHWSTAKTPFLLSLGSAAVCYAIAATVG